MHLLLSGMYVCIYRVSREIFNKSFPRVQQVVLNKKDVTYAYQV